MLQVFKRYDLKYYTDDESNKRGLTHHTRIIIYNGDLMGKKNKGNMPSTSAGLVRYFDDYKETFQIKPETVIIATVFLIISMIFLRFQIG